MIERKRLLSMGYYAKKAVFTGSDGNKNYRVEQYIPEESEDKLLKATVWPGPFCFDKTPDDKKQANTAPFSEEGLLQLVDWMNETSV